MLSLFFRFIPYKLTKLKAVQLNDNLEILYQAEVKFDHDFPEYQTNGGVKAGQMSNEYYCTPVMWIRALETVLDRLLLQGANYMSVISISGRFSRFLQISCSLKLAGQKLKF